MYRPTQLAHYRPTYRPIRPLSTNLSKVVFCRVGTEPYPGCLPRVLPYKNFCEICRTFIPVPGTSVSSARHSYPYPELLSALYARATNTRGTGTAFLYLPGTCVSSVRPCHNTRNLWEFYKHIHTRTPNFWKFCKTPIPLPGIHKPYRT